MQKEAPENLGQLLTEDSVSAIVGMEGESEDISLEVLEKELETQKAALAEATQTQKTKVAKLRDRIVKVKTNSSASSGPEATSFARRLQLVLVNP